MKRERNGFEVASVLLFLCASVFGDWPLYRGGGNLLGVAEGTLPDEPELLWSMKTGGGIRSSVAIAGQVAVFGSLDGKVHAVDAVTGKARWTFDAAGAVEATPAILDGLVFVGCTDGFFYALKVESGKLKWKIETDGQILGAANVFLDKAGTWLVFGSYDYHLYCVSSDTGEVRWTVETDNYINGTPTIQEGLIAFSGCDGLLHVLDAGTGKEEKTIPVGAYIAGSGALVEGTFYVGHYDNEFIAINIDEEAILWRYRKREYPYFSSPAISDDLVIFGGRGQSVHAVDRKTGVARWTFRTRGKVDSSPVVAGRRVVFGSEDGRLYLCHVDNGESIWTYDLGSGTIAAPAVDRGRIYLGTESGEMFCFGVASPPYAKPSRQGRLSRFGKPRSLHPGAKAADWPRFLGPYHAMISAETHLLREWSESGPGLIWAFETGEGFSSPVIGEGCLVYLHRMNDEEVVECRDPVTGDLFWEQGYPTDYVDRYGFNNGPRASPCIDRGVVFTYSAKGVMYAWNLHTGDVVWRRDLLGEYGIPNDFFGVGTSPVAYADWVLVNVGVPGGPCLIALDRRTGETAWGVGDEWGASYATPVVASLGGRDKVFVFAGGESRPPTGGLLIADLETRVEEARFPWRSTTIESVNASSPVVFDDLVYVSHSIRDKGVMMRVSAAGGVETVWTNRSLGAYWMTPVHHEGYLYGFDGRQATEAKIVCLDARTGEEKWRTMPWWEETVLVDGLAREQTARIARGHLLWVDGAFLCLGEFGQLCWLALRPDGCEVLQRATLFHAQQTYAPPILSHGLLYVSQNEPSAIDGSPHRLLCYDLRGPSSEFEP